MIYLDWAATAPPDRECLDVALNTAVETFGNPSSLHTPGKKAASVLIESRKAISRILDCASSQVIFTSGGSESNNIIISSLLLKGKAGSVVVSAMEHSSIHKPVGLLKQRGWEVRWIKPGADGLIYSADVASKVDETTALVAIIHTNNETGAVQPIVEIVEAVRKRSTVIGHPVHIHIDAVQSFGKIEVNIAALGVDSASFSGHKLGGPRGVGILFLKKSIPVLYRGGGQETALRPGTENLPAVTALVRAATKGVTSLQEHYDYAYSLKQRLVKGLSSVPSVHFIPDRDVVLQKSYSPYILTISFPPIPAEVLQRVLNDRGVAVSTGSACSSKKHRISHVLSAMGTPEETAFSAIRVSWGKTTTEEDIDIFLKILSEEVGKMISIFR